MIIDIRKTASGRYVWGERSRGVDRESRPASSAQEAGQQAIQVLRGRGIDPNTVKLYAPAGSSKSGSDRSRIGGKGSTVTFETNPPEKIHFHKLDGAHDFVQSVRMQRKIWTSLSSKERAHIGNMEAAATRALTGHPPRMEKVMAQARKLADDVMMEDARFAKKPSWRRSEEGVECCPALLAAGDDRPMFQRKAVGLSDQRAIGDPVRIVVSTDDPEISDGAAAAFIATAMLVAQFAPVEVWWQGSWLTSDRSRGIVFHVPLILEDMDYNRLDFILSDMYRDSLSYCIMAEYCYYHELLWNDCGHRAKHSYLDKTTLFIDHRGIAPNHQVVGSKACDCLGWDSLWYSEYKAKRSGEAAKQEIPDPYTWHEPDAETMKRWEHEREKEKKQEEKEALKRLGSAK